MVEMNREKLDGENEDDGEMDGNLFAAATFDRRPL